MRYGDCTLPTGAAGLRWVYGDIARLRCATGKGRGSGRVAAINCRVPTGRGAAVVYFVEWRSQRAARRHFEDGDPRPTVWNRAWGYRYRYGRAGRFSDAKRYVSVPFSIRVEGDSKARRHRAVKAIRDFRPPRRLRAVRL